MRLEGSLDAFSLPDIFQLLSYTKKTGALHLRRTAGKAAQHGVVFVVSGSVTGATSDLSRQSLARRLVGAGHVLDDALAAALERASSGEGIGFGRALREAGAVDESVLHDAASGHAVDAVFDLLRWTDGDFAFVVDEPNPDDLGASMSVEDIVAEGRRRLDLWPTLVQSIPSSDTVLSVALSPPEDLAISSVEWALLAIIDGQRSVADLVAISGCGEFGVVETLAALAQRGLVVVRREGDEPEGVSQLLTRQAALSAFEAALAGIPLQITVEPEPEPAPGVHDEPAAAPGDETVEKPDAEAASAPAAAMPIAERRHQEPTDVTPARPEPFLPRRRPDHPEEPKIPAARQPAAPMGVPVASSSRPGAPGSGGGRREAVVHGTSAVADPEPLSSYIDRDPSVNKSLLLRLIAGVRGL